MIYLLHISKLCRIFVSTKGDKIMKQTFMDFYDEISRVLTNFEHPEETGDEMGDLVSDLYDTLVKVQNYMADGTLKYKDEE